MRYEVQLHCHEMTMKLDCVERELNMEIKLMCRDMFCDGGENG